MIPIDVADLPPGEASLPIPLGVQRVEMIEFDRSSASNQPANLNPSSLESVEQENDVIHREVTEQDGRKITIERKKDGTIEIQVLVKN